MADSTTTTRVTSLRTVAVPVNDQARALKFYTEILGLEQIRDFDLGGGNRWVEVAPAAGGATIALVNATESATAGADTGIRLTTPDADALHAHLVEHGTSADDVLRWPGAPPMFTFRDPDGNNLVIVEVA